MALGYEGYASLKVGATITNVALAQGGGIPRSRRRLDSSSGYGGKIKTPAAQMGIGAPHTYDWDSFTGSLSFEANLAFLTNQIKPWLFDRQAAAVLKIQTRYENIQRWDYTFWTSINLSASEGGLLTGSINFDAIGRDDYEQGGKFIENRTGGNDLCDNSEFPKFLNGTLNKNPIPYWNTSIIIDGAPIEFTGWNLDFSQEVVQFFACENNTDPVEPKFVAVGPMSARFSGDFVPLEDVSTTFVPSNTPLSTLVVNMSTLQLSMQAAELNNEDDQLQNGDSLVPIAVDYEIYKLIS